MHFLKYHGLGNDYIVMEVGRALTSAEIQQICHRNYGPGSDGILVQVAAKTPNAFAVRIFNPDGSVAEKSGNGLRIFSRYLYDRKLVKADTPFQVETLGGTVTSTVQEDGARVTVEMGQVDFLSLNETLMLGHQQVVMNEVSIGNPHCVLFWEGGISAETAILHGSKIETHERFPARINVQFAEVLDRKRLRIEIWERGAGYTLASGSSSCSAAAVAHKLGFVDSPLEVQMPGGTLDITIDEGYGMTMSGPVVKVMEGEISAEIFSPSP